jgi:hypothetical protein
MAHVLDSLNYQVPCTPELLATLGPLLCLYRADDPHALHGWSWAKSVQACIKINSDGPREALTFLDEAKRVCWQLYLLPDSDYLSWDRVLSCVRCQLDSPQTTWRKKIPGVPIAQMIGNPIWRACALRFYAVPNSQHQRTLALGDVCLSHAGRKAAEAIAKSEGASASCF